MMLYKAKSLKGYRLNSRNGDIGKIKEFYFDDRFWTIRYLVADAGNWLSGRQVLISPYALGLVNSEAKEIGVDLTKKQIEDSPSLDSNKPVSRQFEQAYYGHFGYPLYWTGLCAWGYYPYPARVPEQWKKTSKEEKAWDPDLRSTNDVSGHHIQGTDGEIGHVEDFFIDDQTWAIRYLVVDTHNWLPGEKVLISPQWIDRISWGERKVFVNLPREAIKLSPEFKEESLLSRAYETDLCGHYNRPEYWADELIAK
jgi:PRC-barrel domain